MIRMLCFTMLLGLGVSVARADPYWIAYEGNDFPENEGWTRIHGDIPAQRWIEDGKLFIDSRAELGIYDSYRIYSSGSLAPEPGEVFVMQWRLKVHYVSGLGDPGVSVISDDQHSVVFVFEENRVWSGHEPNTWAPLEVGRFHQYELRSPDMRTYELYIDGALALQGTYYESLFSGRVAWGDIATGRSLSEWDCVRFGIVPEPATAQAFALGLLVWRITR